MALENITMEQLRAENPALFQSIQQGAVNVERERHDEIDALTLPGYEDMAAQAKANGTSVVEFQKQLVAAMKEKKAEFIQNRVNETKPSQKITGGAPAGGMTEEEEIQQNAKDVAAYAAEFHSSCNGNGMF